ncbi:MAG: T9SS type A sorting domain-containing protein [Bacteroidota bacterium]
MKKLFLIIFAVMTASAQTVTKTFQHGVNGYWGGRSVDISSLNYAENNQNGTTFADGNSDWCIGYLKNTSHGYDIFPLIRFDSLAKYLPANAEIVSAKLTLTFVQWEKPVRVIGRYLAVEWDADVYDPSGGVSSPKIGWSTRKQGTPWGGKGAGSSGADYLAGTSFIVPDAQKKIPANGKAVYTVELDKSVVQEWLDPAKNFGFKLETDTVGIHIYVAQHQRYLQGTQPKLEIEYKQSPTSVNAPSAAPHRFELMQNYPNPFNPSTTLGFTIKVSGPVTLKIYDALGREVSTLVNEHLEAGVHHQYVFNALQLPSGIYFADLRSSGVHQIRKMLLVK